MDGISRRGVLLGAVGAVCARPEFNAPTGFSAEEHSGIVLAWGFIDDGESDVDKMAAAVMRALEHALKQYNVVGWRRAPEWHREESASGTRYKLTARAIVKNGNT